MFAIHIYVCSTVGILNFSLIFRDISSSFDKPFLGAKPNITTVRAATSTAQVWHHTNRIRPEDWERMTRHALCRSQNAALRLFWRCGRRGGGRPPVAAPSRRARPCRPPPPSRRRILGWHPGATTARLPPPGDTPRRHRAPEGITR